ncbi:YjhX family toxin [Sandaracinobacter sp. RS1-74]|uniref:YjhX family toxin n=1 Tax=Sandaracinobacteroides sayramensis TaxID=2913411 RepID=UPI001ED9F2B9|nr:YjhX family toxin [Sandaracinobacteroides sayramensis]MCG2839983.1 YjhX family toxin [Sandaracinobacteroides sayramensis]
MDISRSEQRILHLMAQGGAIRPVKDARGHIIGADCFTREGWKLSGFDLAMFRKLKRRRAIASTGGQPYRITRRGLELVRSELDNR